MEVKKSNKGLVVVIVILVILLLGVIGYICYDKFSQKDELNSPNEANKTEELISGNSFSLKDVKCEEEDTNYQCTKTVKLAYGNANHEVKIKLEKINKETDYSKLAYSIYVDNDLVGTTEGGSFMRGNLGVDASFDGSLLVFDGKYLGFAKYIQGEENFEYELVLLNDNKIIKDDVNLGKMDMSTGDWIESISQLPFDGTNLEFWYLVCGESANDGNFSYAKISLSFDGQNVITKSTDKKDNVQVGGSVGASCYDIDTNTFKLKS